MSVATQECGTTGAYASGCRCLDCRAANAAYIREWRHARLRPMVVPPDVTVPAGSARRHLETLRASGLGTDTIAERAGVHYRAVERIAAGEMDRVTPAVRDAILAVSSLDLAPHALVPADDTVIHLADLIDLGWTRYRIAKATGLPKQTVHDVGSCEHVTHRTASAITALWRTEVPAVTEDADDDLLNLFVELGDQSWKTDAECRRLEGDPRDRVNLFFPERGGDTDTARAICAQCPVTRECLDFALRATSAISGIWGGTTGKDRRELRRGD